jgi:hypothetical protein
MQCRLGPAHIAHLHLHPPHARAKTAGKNQMTLKDYAALSVSESQMQQALIKWWALKCKEWQIHESLLMAFPLQGVRTARNGARMKAEGMRRGTPDMFLAVKEGTVGNKWIVAAKCGLWIELKTLKGKVSPEQTLMLGLLADQGFAIAICRSFDEAETVIGRYLNAP